MEINIESNSPEQWSKLSEAEIDFIPDPMILRTAELFFNGRSGCLNLSIDSEEVWKSIQLNLDGLLAFFDILLTRENIPLIEYWLTFESPNKSLKDLLGTKVIPVKINYDLYNLIKDNATENLGDLKLNRLPSAIYQEVENELGNYKHEWRPGINLDIPQEWQRIAEFLLGGFIFSGYAQASGCDHIIQTKRSRLYTELLTPDSEPSRYGYQKEKELFQAFTVFCRARQFTDVNEFKFAPNILPLLLSQAKENRQNNPMYLLELAMGFREKNLGEVYQKWWQQLRDNWRSGMKNRAAERELDIIRTELERKLKDELPSREMQNVQDENTITAEMSASTRDGLSFSLTREISMSEINQWIKGWYMRVLPINRHRKLMYRMYLEEFEYERLDLGLKELWMKS